MRIVLMLVAMVFAFACSKDQVNDAKVKVKEAIVAKAPGVIAEKLECANVAAITDDVKLTLDKLVHTESTGSVVCTALATSLVPALVGTTIPAKWECKATDVKDKLTDAAAKICEGV